MRDGVPVWEPYNPLAAVSPAASASPARPALRPRRRPRKRMLTRLAFALLWLFVFTIPWENLIVLPGVGTAGKLAGFAAFAAGLVALLDSGRLRVPSGYHMLMLAFVLWAGLTYFWSVAPQRSLEMAATYAQLFGMVWLIWQYAPAVEEQSRLIGAYLLGSCVSAADTILTYFDRGRVMHYQRYVAYGFDPNDLGLILALSVPLAVYMSVVYRRGIMAWLYRLQPVLAILAILFTASRGALISLTVGLLLVPLVLRNWSAKIKTAYALVAISGLAAAIVFVPASSLERLAGTANEIRTGTLNQRRLIWQAGAESFRQRPVQGVGAGGFSTSVATIVSNPSVGESVAHNSFLSVLVEEGIVGLSLFLGFVLALLFAALDLPRLERCLWLVTGATWMIGVFALTWEYRKPGWFLFGLLAARLASRTRPAFRRAAPPVPVVPARVAAAALRGAR